MDQVQFVVGEAAEMEQTGAGLPVLLEQAAACLNNLDQHFVDSVKEFSDLQQRLLEGRFHLAVLGQFKRGKSTLLNALLGDDILPTDILPVTAIPTFIRSGENLDARVHFTDGRESAQLRDGSLVEFLLDYVTEAGNPHNLRHVSRVEIFHPAPLLQQGVVLIDTPGIGSTLKHNTEVAHQILPQCDAALFLVSPDPPITETELDYLAEIQQQMPRTFFLLNKVDFLDEEDCQASLRFLAEQLTPLCNGAPQIMPISARKGLRARLANDHDGWQASGMQLVERNLIDFLAREKQQTLQLALTQKTTDRVNEALLQLNLTLSALKLPKAELQQRIDQFQQSLSVIEREQQAATDVLAGDLKRAIERLGVEIAAVREKTRQQLGRQVESYLETVGDPEEMERLVRDAMTEEIPQFFAPAMRTAGEVIRSEATELLKLNQQRSNRLIEQVRSNAAELFDIPYHAPSAVDAYLPINPPSWNLDLFVSDLDPLGQRLSRKLFSHNFRRKRTVTRLREESRKLLNKNVEQISWTLRRSLDESFRHFSAELKDQLENTIDATRRAINVAAGRRDAHCRDTAAEEIKLQQAVEKLEQIRQGLAEL